MSPRRQWPSVIKGILRGTRTRTPTDDCQRTSSCLEIADSGRRRRRIIGLARKAVALRTFCCHAAERQCPDGARAAKSRPSRNFTLR